MCKHFYLCDFFLIIWNKLISYHLKQASLFLKDSGNFKWLPDLYFILQSFIKKVSTGAGSSVWWGHNGEQANQGAFSHKLYNLPRKVVNYQASKSAGSSVCVRWHKGNAKSDMIQSDFVYSCVRPLWGNEIGQPSVWESWRKKHSRQGKCINSRSQSRKKFGVFKKQKGVECGLS